MISTTIFQKLTGRMVNSTDIKLIKIPGEQYQLVFSLAVVCLLWNGLSFLMFREFEPITFSVGVAAIIEAIRQRQTATFYIRFSGDKIQWQLPGSRKSNAVVTTEITDLKVHHGQAVFFMKDGSKKVLQLEDLPTNRRKEAQKQLTDLNKRICYDWFAEF